MSTTNTAGSQSHGHEIAGTLYEPVTKAKVGYLNSLRAIGAEPVSNFTFARPDGSAVTLDELFGEHDDLLAIHNMGRSCSYCTLWADALIGIAPHLMRRAALVLVSADEPARLADAIAERGWNYPCVSGRDSGFNDAMRFGTSENAAPGVSSFHRAADGSITRIAATGFGPGDDFCPVWPFMDLLKDGANGWEPR